MNNVSSGFEVRAALLGVILLCGGLLAGCSDADDDGTAGDHAGSEVVIADGYAEVVNLGDAGDPCESDADCHSGLCLELGDGLVCTERCEASEECAEGWTCIVAPGLAPTCMPADPALCRPCLESAACDALDVGAACVSYGDEGLFCSAGCARCPLEWACVKATLADGTESQQCIAPDVLPCACNQHAVDAGAATTCARVNEYGQCDGTRFCDDVDELTFCSAATPKPESCNGADDDCDGVIDEEDAEGCLDYYKDDDHDGRGSGPAKCLCTPGGGGGGHGGYTATKGGDCGDGDPLKGPGAAELCDNVDNDCNGQTDEGLGATTCGLGECEHTVQNCVNGDWVVCDPFEGWVLEACNEEFLDDDCDGVTDEGCKEAGESCDLDTDCYTGHCQNGFCCDAGDCCAEPLDCPANYGAEPVCLDAALCGGEQLVPTCENFQCGSEFIVTPEGCDTLPCDDDDVCTFDGACDAGTCALGPPLLFEATFGGPGDQHVAAAVGGEDGVVVAGATAEGAVWLVGLDPLGGIVWEHSITDDKTPVAAAIATAADGAGWLLAGRTTAEGEDRGWLLGADSEGATAWSLTVGPAGGSALAGLVATSDGALAAGHQTAEDESTDAWLVQVSSAGEIVSETLFGGEGDQRFGALAAAGDGVTAAGTDGAGRAWLVRLDADHTVVWERTFVEVDVTAPLAVLGVADGGNLLVGSVAGSEGDRHPWLVRTDIDGTVEWQRILAGVADETVFGVTAAGTGFAIAGDVGGDAALIRVDSQGQLLWRRALGGQATDVARSVLPASNGLILVGETASTGAGGTDGWLVRLDAFGNGDCVESGPCLLTDPGTCDDGDPCTTDRCLADAGCFHEPLPEGWACGSAATCRGGACVADMIVVGQSSFHGTAPNRATPGGDTLSLPVGLLEIGDYAYVAEMANNRVLILDGGLDGEPIAALGQPDLASGLANAGKGGPTAATLSSPTQLATDGTRLLVADFGNSRVLVWNELPSTSMQPADVVIGQQNFGAGAVFGGQSAVSATHFQRPWGLAIVGEQLVVSDMPASRLLVYDSIPTTNGASADGVIGQADFESADPNRGEEEPSALSFKLPQSLSTDGTRLLVADWMNHRVLIFDKVPTALDVPADRVLGQAAFDTRAAGAGAAGMRRPRHGLIVGDGLYVADGGNHRLLHWAKVPQGDGAPADGVVGQTDFDGNKKDGGGAVSATGLNSPSYVHSDGDGLVVSDYQNHRVLAYATPPTSSADLPSAVVGQPGFDSGKANIGAVKGAGFDCPKGLAVNETHLVVSDRNNGRVLVFDKADPQAGPSVVLGKPDFETGCLGKSCPDVTPGDMNIAEGVAFDSGGRLYVGDWYKRRAVVIFDEMPSENGAAPDWVIGHLDLDTGGANDATVPAAGRISDPEGVNVVQVEGQEKLLVSDCANNRVLVFDLPIAKNGATAVQVIGQPDFETTSAGTSQTKMNCPVGAYYDGYRLWVTEFGPARRALVYAGFPEGDGPAATWVIGQPEFDAALDAPAPVADAFGSLWTNTMTTLDGLILIPDHGWRRVAAFDPALLENGMAATRVFGQPDFETQDNIASNLAGTALGTFSGGSAVVSDPDGEHLWLTACHRHRVLRVRADAFWRYAGP